MNARDERFALFDSLRALAALSVLVYHVGFAPGAIEAFSWLAPYVKRLDVGVSVFFLISGFLLYRPFVRAHLAGEERPAAGPYAWRRFLRLAPGYWVALTVVTIWIGLGGVFTGGGVVTYYGFGQVYRAETFGGGILQAWTLGVEISFYALLPLYAWVLRRLLRSRPHLRLHGEAAGLALLAAVGLVWTGASLSHFAEFGGAATPFLFSLPAFLHQFAAGMALALASVVLHERHRRPAAVRIIERFPGVAWLAAAGVFAVIAIGIGLDEGAFTDREWFLRSVLATVLGVCLLLPAVFGDGRHGAVRRLLGSRVMLYLGTVSYGIYLYHVAVIKQLERWGVEAIGGDPVSLVAWTLLVTAGATLLAALSWRLVERPALRLRGRVTSRRSGRERTRPADVPSPLSEPAPAPAGTGGP